MKITKNEFGMTKDNQPISLYTIENASGASVTLSDYGCRIIKIMVPNKEGKLTDVILGLMNADEYLADDASLGAVVGRCANRIAKGHFTLNDKEYNLAINNGPNHLHGGPTGFAQRVWTGKVTDDKVTFTRISPDGEEGYPGNLTVSVTYGWSEDNELSIVYEASCDQDTVFSVTSHGYFNLNGEGNGTVLDQELRIDADACAGEVHFINGAHGTNFRADAAATASVACFGFYFTDVDSIAITISGCEVRTDRIFPFHISRAVVFPAAVDFFHDLFCKFMHYFVVFFVGSACGQFSGERMFADKSTAGNF